MNLAGEQSLIFLSRSSDRIYCPVAFKDQFSIRQVVKESKNKFTFLQI